MKWILLLASLALLVLGVHCGEYIGRFPGPPASMPNITFASTVPADHKARLTLDFKFLTTLLILDEYSKDIKKSMQLPDVTPQSLVNWLNDRIQYILPSSYDSVRSTVFLRRDLRNESLADQPRWLQENRNRLVSGATQSLLVAMNLGEAIYKYAKDHNQVAFMQIPGVGIVRVNSPRVGIIQEGDGLMADLTQSRRMDSAANRVHRLATLFHEGAHSDGNSDHNTLGMPHVICPPGHHYAGYYACDQNSNGPYMIEADFIMAFVRSCFGCFASTSETLKVFAADYYSRSISNDVWDITPEGAR